MSVAIVVARDLSHQVEHANALVSGLRHHGITAQVRDEGDAVPEETVCCWGWRIGKPLRDAGKDVLVLERGYIGDRMRWTSMGWNGLNGRARFRFGDDSRLHLFERQLRTWNPKGAYALIVGQVDGDAAVAGVDLPQFYNDCAQASEVIFGLPPRFRPHPVATQFGQCVRVSAAVSHGSLHDDLENAAVVITWNSNTGVDAVMQGKPTIAFDRGSMAWPVASHGYRITPEPDRRAWLSSLSWCQWSIDEIRSGAAWDHVSQFRDVN